MLVLLRLHSVLPRSRPAKLLSGSWQCNFDDEYLRGMAEFHRIYLRLNTRSFATRSLAVRERTLGNNQASLDAEYLRGD